ncbi:MAG: trypsin-like serine peptidase [Roseococcus sp.]
MIRPALALLLALAAGPALAQGKPGAPITAPPPALPGIGSEDPRRVVSPREMPWAALGRVVTGLGSRCTGTLIAPDRVLTAAHCLVAPGSLAFAHPHAVEFLLGYERGAFRARARVAHYRMGLGYDPLTGGPAREDWAILTLETPLPGPFLPLLDRPPPPRSPLMLGGYQADAPEVLQADLDCRLLEAREGVLLHDCAGTRGASGGPVLTPTRQGWAVAGVASRVARDLALGAAASIEAVQEGLR